MAANPKNDGCKSSENFKLPIVKNAVTCGICQSPADRYDNYFQCQKNPNHVGDLTVGIFSDLTYSPEKWK